MMRTRVLTILFVLISASMAAVGESQHVFQPQSTIVLGTSSPETTAPFTQVITQLAGELSISSGEEHFVNLVPNWPLLVRTVLTNPKPVVAYTMVAWGTEIIRITCWVDRANSDLLRGHIRVVMEATEGTTASVPVGTVVAISDGRLTRNQGMFGLKTQIVWTPGILPDVLPTPMTFSTQVAPGLWRTGGPGLVTALCTFTSVEPPDGSPALVYTVREGLPIR